MVGGGSLLTGVYQYRSVATAVTLLLVVVFSLGGCGSRGHRLSGSELFPGEPPLSSSEGEGLSLFSANKEITIRDIRADLDGLEEEYGLTGELFSELRVDLERQLSERGSEKLLRRAPTPDRKNQIALVIYLGHLRWEEARAGDYDNDGYVTGRDLLLIALYFGQSSYGEGGTYFTGFGGRSSDILDWNGDKIWNAGDVTPIALHFGESTGGYSIYEADDSAGTGKKMVARMARPDPPPISPDSPLPPYNYSLVSIRYDTTASLEYRDYYSGVEPNGWIPIEGKWYQVVPYDTSDPPEESASVSSEWAKCPINGRAPGGPATILVTTGAGSLSWYEVRPGDCNNDGIVNDLDVDPFFVYAYKNDFLGDPDFYKYAEYLDDNGDGTLNAGDLAPVAYRFGESTGGYNIYEADDENGTGNTKVASIKRPPVPADPDNPPFNVSFATLQYNTLTGEVEPAGWRPSAGKWYQVVPHSKSIFPDESESVRSNWVSYTE